MPEPKCPDCSRPISMRAEKCDRCGRTNFLEERIRHALWQVACSQCVSDGENDPKMDCDECQGTGKVFREVKLFENVDLRINQAISSRHGYFIRAFNEKETRPAPERLLGEFMQQDPLIPENEEHYEEDEELEASGVCPSCTHGVNAETESCPIAGRPSSSKSGIGILPGFRIVKTASRLLFANVIAELEKFFWVGFERISLTCELDKSLIQKSCIVGDALTKHNRIVHGMIATPIGLMNAETAILHRKLNSRNSSLHSQS